MLGLLVALSLILLTAYFGESGSGGLHALQRGVVRRCSPIQEGASRALKPVRDLFGWFGDTLQRQEASATSCKTEVAQLRDAGDAAPVGGSARTRELRGAAGPRPGGEPRRRTSPSPRA